MKTVFLKFPREFSPSAFALSQLAHKIKHTPCVHLSWETIEMK